ncbi:Fur family transcriptional regulator [Hathewaya massiliensis]|uniref:Fur family transcriptional regulator n=1 Tax=Hathewaya massiliensis TaxID=1964382 RepID=UPI0011593F98|nr:transcriptional repressor [Hathewaya massiliensis]
MNCEAYLKNAKIKITKGRVSVLKLFIENSSPINAEEIYLSLRNEKIKIDLSTVYRTLELFEEKHIVTKIIGEDDRKTFILKEKGHKHTLECSLCHKEVEYECPMPKIKEILKKETGFDVTCGDVSLKGICDSCKGKG